MKSLKRITLLFCTFLSLLLTALPVFAAAQVTGSDTAAVQNGSSLRNRKKIAFICLDGTGKATTRMRSLWQRQVRQAYPRAKYEFIEDPQVLEKGRDVLFANGGVDKTVEPYVLSQVADKTGADVVALLVVRTMEEYYVQSFFFNWDEGPETYLRVITASDHYMFKKDGQRYKKKKLRKVETTDVALAIAPYIEIRNAMSDLARSFEGLPLI
jgi:hypothetical protein